MFAGRGRRRLQVQHRTDGDPVAAALRRRVRGARAGRDRGGPDGDGGGPLDTGQGPVRGPVGQRGGGRPGGRRVQRAAGVVPVRRIGHVRGRRRVHRGPVLDVGDPGRPGGERETGGRRGRPESRGGRRRPPETGVRGQASVQHAPAAAAPAYQHRAHSRHGIRGERAARSAGHSLAIRPVQLK